MSAQCGMKAVVAIRGSDECLVERNAEEFGFDPHDWDYGVDGMNAVRQCRKCGAREAYWDDEEYPINPCSGPGDPGAVS